LRFGGGLPLHKVNCLIFSNLREVPTTSFVIFPSKISYGFLLCVSPLPRCDRCPALHPLIAFVVLFFFRHSGSLTPRSFIHFLPRSCCLRPTSLRPPLHSGFFRSLFPSFSRFLISCSAWFLAQSLLTKFSLIHATLARRVVLIPAMANSLCCPQISWVPVLQKSFLFRHTTAAWWDTFLQAAANFLWDPQFPRVSSFGCPRHPAVDFRTLRRLLGFATSITATSSLGTS
jgi:hypothetical protein